MTHASDGRLNPSRLATTSDILYRHPHGRAAEKPIVRNVYRRVAECGSGRRDVPRPNSTRCARRAHIRHYAVLSTALHRTSSLRPHICPSPLGKHFIHLAIWGLKPNDMSATGARGDCECGACARKRIMSCEAWCWKATLTPTFFGPLMHDGWRAGYAGIMPGIARKPTPRTRRA